MSTQFFKIPVNLRKISKSCFIRHHRTRCTIFFPMCRFREVNLLKFQKISWLKKEKKHQDKFSFLFPLSFHIVYQGSHYFQIRGRSDFSFRELTRRSGRQQREVGRHCFATPLKLHCPNLVNS